MALTNAFKLSIDVLKLGAIELVTPPVLAKTQILLLSAPHGETKPESIYHCPNVCESCGQFIRKNLFKNHDETQVGLDWKYPISELIKLRLTT